MFDKTELMQIKFILADDCIVLDTRTNEIIWNKVQKNKPKH